MNTPVIFDSEYRFCLILWDVEPIKSARLAEVCKEKLGWSRTTTYTVIKRLSDRGVIQNKDSVVTSIISKEQAQISEFEQMMEKKFEGSLPAFFAAFTRQQNLTDTEFDELEKMIAAARSKGGKGGHK